MDWVREARTAAYRAPEDPQGGLIPAAGLSMSSGRPSPCGRASGFLSRRGGVMEGSQRGLPCGPFRVSGKLRFASDNYLAFCKEFWIL